MKNIKGFEPQILGKENKCCGTEKRMRNLVWTTALALDIIAILLKVVNGLSWIGGYSFNFQEAV